MASVRKYALIYAALLVMGTVQFVLFETDVIEFTYAVAMLGVVILSVSKTFLVAGYFMHLVEEPRSISYVMAIAVFMVLLLAVAAGYSIQ
ncbi:MAG: cytochrome C oxidase subunit IV family protein [Halobacteriota archaeon]